MTGFPRIPLPTTKRQGCFATLVLLVLLVAHVAIRTWTLMLLLGVLWSELGVLKPIGFWASLPIAWLLAGLVASPNASTMTNLVRK